jgi:hypothetical protein
MLMGRRILNRKEMRADYDEAERRNKDEDQEAEDELEDEDEDEDEDEEAAEEEESGEEEEEPVAAKKKKPAPKAKPKSRARAAKVVRMRVVWGVYNNSNQLVTTYEYPKKQDAVAHAAKLTTDKKSTHFVQPVKEPIEEKKEK